MQTVNRLDLSIIILTYKSKDHLAALLPSVFGSEGMEFEHDGGNGASERSLRQTRGLLTVSDDDGMPRHAATVGNTNMISDDRQAEGLHYTAEVIIVDNDSGDGTAEFAEQWSDINLNGRLNSYQVIRNQNNGFAAGNNLGIKKSSGKYILLLNPDTKLEPGTLKTMLDFIESRPDVGISGCKLIKADGTLDLACRRRFPNPWNSFARLFLKNNQNYNYSDISEDQEMEVDSVVGAFLLIRRSVLDKIGLLDEDFFMYGEDLDWCWRCKEAGYKVWYYPNTFMHHYKGESSKKARLKTLRWFHDAMWIFYKKHYYQKYPLVFSWLVFFGIYARFGLLVVINLFTF